jgi:hypothetical protein
MSNPTTKAAREAAIDKAKTAFVFHESNMSRVLIQTRYFGPTDRRGSRIKATSRDGRKSEPSILIPYDYDLGASGNHSKAAAALALMMGWLKDDEDTLCGSTDGNGSGFFVLVREPNNGQRNNAKGGWAV